MLLQTPRFLLRDFRESDRPAFLAYQMDERYRRLYDLDENHEQQADALFNLFVSWQGEEPRRNLQLGIFERQTGRLCGCAGLRRTPDRDDAATLGIELTPDDWGRYRLALEVAGTLIEYGFSDLGLDLIVGTTSSGNERVERLARWLGAELVGDRDGPGWMAARGWSEVDWALQRNSWVESGRKRTLRPMRN